MNKKNKKTDNKEIDTELDKDQECDEPQKYNQKAEYTAKIEPLVNQIMVLCDQYRIPAFLTFAVSNNKKETKYETVVSSAPVVNRELYNDTIRKHTLVMDGFDVVPQRQKDRFEDMFGDDE